MVIIGSLLIKLVQIFFNIISEIFVREMCYLIILCNSNSNLFKYFKGIHYNNTIKNINEKYSKIQKFKIV